MAGFIGGIASGMDTASMIDQLMQLEGITQSRLKTRVRGHETAITALQSINTKMQALLTAAKDVRKPESWNSVKATSSDPSVSVSARTGAIAGSTSFTVKELAKAEVETTSTAVASTGTVVASGGKLTFTKAGSATPVELSVGDGSLASIASAINAKSDLGVRATTIQVEPGQYRLQLTSTTTGAASAFSVSGFDAAYATTELTAGTDALIQFGDNPLGQIKSASNTFDNVVPGVTFTVSAKDKTVTLDLTRDAERTADKVKAVVDAANAALDEIRKQSAVDPTTKRGGPLAAELVTRDLVQRVLGTVSGGTTSMAAAGIELTRDGKVTFTRDKFLTALKENPDGTRALFGQPPAYTAGTTKTSGSVSLTGSHPDAAAGTYDVVVTQAARKASAAGTVVPVAGEVFQLKRGTEVAEYTVQVGDDLAKVAAGLNAAAVTKKLDITVSGTATELKAESKAYGSAATFQLTQAGLPLAATAGVDVAGTVGGVSATGSGQTLTVPTTAPGPTGVSLTVTLTADDVTNLAGGPAGTVTLTRGFGDRVAAAAEQATDRFTGKLTSAVEGRRSNITSLNTQIESWDDRLEMRRAALIRQFGAMEKALGTMRNQSNWLAGQIAALPRNNY